MSNKRLQVTRICSTDFTTRAKETKTENKIGNWFISLTQHVNNLQ